MRTEDDLTAAEQLMRLNNEMATMVRERTREKRELEQAQARLESAMDDLRVTCGHLERIQDLLPICMDCGQAPEDADWSPLVEYLRANQVSLRHGRCSACADAAGSRRGED